MKSWDEQIQSQKGSEKIIKQSRDNFRTLFESIEDLIFILDKKGTIIDINKIVSDMLGYNEDEIIGKKIFFLHPSARKGELENILKNALAYNSEFCRIPLITKGRIKVHVETKINKRIMSGQEVLLWISKDITEKTLIEQMRDESRKRAIIIKEITVSANRADSLPELNKTILESTLELLDFDSGCIYLREHQSNFAEIVYHIDLGVELLNQIKKIDILAEPYHSVFANQKEIIVDNYKKIDSNLSEKYNIKGFASIPLTAGKNVLGALNIMKNNEYQFSDFERNTLITIGQELGNAIKKMQYRKQLRESRDNLEKRVQERTEDLISLTKKLQDEVNDRKEAEEKYRNLFENVGEGIMLVDSAAKILMANKTSEKIFELQKNNLIGAKLNKFVNAKHLSRLRDQLNLSQQGKKTTYELEIIRPDKESRNIVVTSTPQQDKNSEFVGILNIFRDITEQKIAEAKSKELELKMFSQSKMAALGEVATGVAHEINQPLFYINTIIQTLLGDFEMKEVDAGDAIEGLQNSEIQVQRIVNIIDHLRTFGRADNRYTIDVNLNTVLENSMLILGEKIKHQKIKLIKNIQSDLPPIQANPTQIEQIFLNLFQNSIHALENKEGHAEIEISIWNNKQKKSISLSFSDNGKGIPEKTQEQIFEPFFTTKGVGKGTGLGLSIIYGIVKDHKGEITCESEIGKGTTFRIVFPY